MAAGLVRVTDVGRCSVRHGRLSVLVRIIWCRRHEGDVPHPRMTPRPRLSFTTAKRRHPLGSASSAVKMPVQRRSADLW
jgi:hypothetical protein